MAFGIILLPMAIIMLQPDAGTFLVFCSFALVFYREGMNPTIIVLGWFRHCHISFLPYLVDKLYLIIGVVVIGLLYYWGWSPNHKKSIAYVGGHAPDYGRNI